MTSLRDPLKEVASWALDPQPAIVQAPPGVDIEAFIVANDLLVRRGPLPWDGRGRKWELQICPFNAEHTGGCAVLTESANGAIGFKCHHNGCANKHWRDVRELFDGTRGKSRPTERFYPKTAATGSLSTRCLYDIDAKPVRYLWPGRIARGKVTIIAGDPGLGKSQIAASITAVVTAGGCWPVDREQCEPADVLFLTAEDDPADTLRPRLEAAGADLRRVHVIDGVVTGETGGEGNRQERTFSLQRDVQALELKLRQLPEVAAVFVDPITAYLGDTDSHKNAEIRGLLAPLNEVATRHSVAIIGVSHLSKAAGAKVLMRVNGSLAFVAAARAVYLVASDRADKRRRLFLPIKNNLGPDTTGLAFCIEGATVTSLAGPVSTSRVAWESEPVTMTADEAMQAAEATQKSTSAVDEAADWLRETLADGPMPAAQIFGWAKAEGISTATLRRSAKTLAIKTAKLGMGDGWEWSLPPKVLKPAEDAQQKSLSTFGGIEHLREPMELGS